MGDWQPDPNARDWTGWQRTAETTVIFEAFNTLVGHNNILQVHGTWRGLWAAGLFRADGRWFNKGPTVSRVKGWESERFVHTQGHGESIRTEVSGVNGRDIERLLTENLACRCYDSVCDMTILTILAFKAPMEQVVTLETWPDQPDPNKVVCRIHGFEGHSHYCLQAHYRNGRPPRLVQPPNPSNTPNKAAADKWLRQSIKELDAKIRKVLNVDP